MLKDVSGYYYTSNKNMIKAVAKIVANLWDQESLWSKVTGNIKHSLVY